MARQRFQRYTAAEKSRVLAKYRRLIAAGKSPTAAARAAGTDLNVIEKWSDAESTPVAVVRDRPCLGGCGERSEEHTSELQSLMRISYAVFCLKKKKQDKEKTQDIQQKKLSRRITR